MKAAAPLRGRDFSFPAHPKKGFVAGLTPAALRSGVEEVYQILDLIDASLLSTAGMRLSSVVELANLSSIIGNVLAAGILKNCGSAFQRAGAHKFQDLRACGPGAEHIEIKVALETNKPKGHLAEGKAGYYLACRYVLGALDGSYTPGERGDVVWIWEVRLGYLAEADFSVSNTEGDSGKTAVVTTEAYKRMAMLYFDERFCPYKSGASWYLETYGS